MPDSFDEALAKARKAPPSFDEALSASKARAAPSFDEALAAPVATADPIDSMSPAEFAEFTTKNRPRDAAEAKRWTERVDRELAGPPAGASAGALDYANAIQARAVSSMWAPAVGLARRMNAGLEASLPKEKREAFRAEAAKTLAPYEDPAFGGDAAKDRARDATRAMEGSFGGKLALGVASLPGVVSATRGPLGGVGGIAAYEGSSAGTVDAAAKGAAFAGLGGAFGSVGAKIAKRFGPEVADKVMARVANGSLSFAAAGQVVNGTDAEALAVDAALGGVLGIVHGRAKGKPAPAEAKPGMSPAEAGAVKAEAVATGVAKPAEVYSPERVAAAENAIAGGRDPVAAVEAVVPERRPDGSIAAPYKPTAEARAEGLIEEGAKAAVARAEAQGVETVSSGVDPATGVGFAVGRDAGGRSVRVEAPATARAPGEVTSLKNRIVAEERAARGVEPLPEEVPQSREGWMAEGRRIVAENPSEPRRIIEDVTKNPRDLKPVETAVLNVHKVNLNAEVAKADAAGIAARERGNLDEAAAHAARAASARAEFDAVDIASKAGGREWGRAGVARQMEVAQDYSLLAMERQRRATSDYKPLSAEQAAETKALHERIAKAEAERDAYRARVAEVESQRGVVKVIRGTRAPRTTPTEYGKANTIFTREAYEAKKAAVKEKMSRLSLNSDPTLLVDLVEMGGFHIEANVRRFADWSKVMTAEFGEKVRPHLQAVWAEAQKQLSGKTIEAVSAKVRDAVKAGRGLDAMPAEVGRLAEMFVRQGVKDRNVLVDKVHGVLRGIDPRITRRETMDAISGYGKSKALDNDPAKVELRDLRGQLQQIAKLEDMAAGKAPLKSGPERQAPGDAQRELIRLVNEAKRKGGYDVPDPATQLKSALEGTKTRLRNEIADLDRQIAAGKKDVPNKTSVALDAEAQTLKARRDKLREDFDAAFGKPGLTDAQRVDAAIKATERSIAEYERRLKLGDLFPAPKVSKTPADPRLDALRAQRDALKQRVDDWRAAATPRKSDGEVALQSLKTRLKNRIAELEKRTAAGDFAPKPERSPTPRDAEAIRLEAGVEMAKKAWNEALFKDHLANRTAAQKAFGAAVETATTARALMTSFDFSGVLRQGGFVALAHPVRAARALPDMFRAFASKEAQARSEAEISMRPNYVVAKRAGLFLAETGPTNYRKMEEAYMSRTAEKIPLVAGSQRAYTTLLNRLRMDSFDAMLAGLSRGKTPTPAEAVAVARFVNAATGRGGGRHGAKLESAIAGATGILFSPRLLASRFQLLAGPLTGFQSVGGGTLRTRKMIAGEYARFLGGLGVVYALAKFAGGDVETDPRSSDFGKIRIGETRIDPTAGLSSAAVFTSRMVTGESKGTSGKVHDLTNPGFGQDDYGEAIWRFLRGKAAPIPGAYLNARIGEKVTGERTSRGKEALGLVTPMIFEDIYDAMKEQGIPKGAALGLLAIFGMGLQVHDEKEPPKRRSKRIGRARD